VESPSVDQRRGVDVVLSAFPWGRYGVRVAILFGSRAGLSPMVKGDWDVAVWPDPGEKYADLVADLAEALRAREEEVDVVVISDDMPAPWRWRSSRGRPGLPRRRGRVPGPHDEVRGRMHRLHDQPVEGRRLGGPRQEDMGILKELAQIPRLVHGGAGDLQPGGSERPQEVFRGPVSPPVAEPGVDRHGATRRRVAGDFA
jgi:predicted nucleotidyltransferase